MADKLVIQDINDALDARAFPTTTLWNRLEGRPRTADGARALKAETRDALWMLTRQWQLGEFRGDDAGSPALARIHTSSSRFDKYSPNDRSVEKFNDDVPLEARVESRQIDFASDSASGDLILSLDIRLLMGRQWLKLISRIGDYKKEFIARYPIQPPDPGRVEDAHICAHTDAWQSFAAASGRLMDGASFYFYLKGHPARRAWDGIAVDPAHRVEIDRQAARFIEWFEELYYQPQGGDAWDPTRLEYRFACSAPAAQGEKAYLAEGYYHGRLDWYNFDTEKHSNGLGGVPEAEARRSVEVTQSLIPAPVVYEGAPNTRWWTIENHGANFAGIEPETTDLAELLLIEFGLAYANDWFIIPHKTTRGAIIRVEGLEVTNSFGERFWIEPAGSNSDDNWQRFSIGGATIKSQPTKKADNGALLLPAVPNVQEGPPLEEVIMIRDEVANLVWAVEKTIPSPTGAGKSGDEAAAETLDFYRRRLQSDPARAMSHPPGKARIRYEVMGAAPENWIPFIPVHVENDVRRIQLQRAAAPRMLEGAAKPEKIRPRTSLLRVGLDSDPPRAYFIHEEEVPQAGAVVTRSFQRTRRHDGGVIIWLATRKKAGRDGVGSNSLAFDRIR